ncbi:MAG: YgfZ/GcvT domain-containing protein [Fimbriiglobus sp.]
MMWHADYEAVKTGAGLFDRSTVGKLRLLGADAPGFLHNISTNDIKPMPLGAGCRTFFCNSLAKALFVADVYHLMWGTQHALWLETTPGYAERLMKHLDKFLIAEAVEISDVTTEFAQLHLAGPKAKEVLEAALGEAIPDLPEFYHMERTFGSTSTASVRKRHLLGTPGYDIVMLAGKLEGVKRMLVAAGAKAGSEEAYEALRIEAGTPVQGVDFGEDRFVMEIGRAAEAVYYAKGCFPGQEPIVMARDRAGRINRSFLRLEATRETALPVGAKLRVGEDDVGLVTSSTLVPGHSLAVGYVHWKHIATGTQLTTDGGVAVTVLGPPVS